MANIVVDGTIGANRLLILDSTGKIPAVDGSLVTAIAAGNIATGTIPVARIDTGSTANKIVVLDGSGRLPAVSAALITNIPGATKSASDPVIATNPSGGVGTEWHNTTSGEVYICTDATAGANVWKNVGAGSGDITPYSYMGESYGYSLGRYAYPAETNSVSMERYAFASSANGTDVGDLPTYHHSAAGLSSTTYGYACGRYNDPSGAQPSMISKVSFASGVEAGVSAGNLTSGTYGQCGVNTAPYGYLAGGTTNHGPYLTTTMIQQIAWASDGSTNSHWVGIGMISISDSPPGADLAQLAQINAASGIASQISIDIIAQIDKNHRLLKFDLLFEKELTPIHVNNQCDYLD